jgi:hypothetical protein
MYLRRGRQPWTRRLAALAPILLLLALAPSGLYIDHWIEHLTAEHHVEEFTPHRRADTHDHHREVHNSHCHGSGGCSDAAATASLDDATFETRGGGPDLPSILVGDTVARMEQVYLIPPTEPPRASPV